MKKRVMLVITFILIMTCLMACKSITREEKTENGLSIDIINTTDFTFKAIDLTYVDESGNDQILVSASKKPGDIASFQVRYTEDFNFTISCVSDEIKVKDYDFEISSIEDNLVLYVKNNDDGTIVVSDIK